MKRIMCCLRLQPSFYAIPDDFKNFMFITVSIEGMNEAVLKRSRC
jgi:hypothetical protein